MQNIAVYSASQAVQQQLMTCQQSQCQKFKHAVMKPRLQKYGKVTAGKSSKPGIMLLIMCSFHTMQLGYEHTLKTSAGALPPPSDRTVSLNLLPVSAMADSFSSPASSKALKASADKTSAHL